MAEAVQPLHLTSEVDTSSLTSKPLRFAADLLSFTGANVLYLVVTAITTFLIPRELSVEAFGAYRLFLLYAGFVGVLHLGYLDGALVSWAASGSEAIRRGLPSATVFIMGILLVETFLAACLWRFSTAPWRWLILPVAIYAIIANLTTISLYALQAAKRFSLLSFLTLLQPSLLLLGVCALALRRLSSTGPLLFVYLCASAITLAVAWAGAYTQQNWRWPSLSQVLHSAREYLLCGGMILISNLATNLILSADRVVISSQFSIRQFAIYSFAATFFYSAFLVVLSAAKVLFPYLSTEVAGIHINRIYALAERLVIVFWAIGLISYFPIAWLIRLLLPTYLPSIPLVRILLLGTGVVALTQLLHSNFYRIMRRPAALMFVGTASTIATFAALVYMQRFGTLSLLAWTTVGSVFAWWLLGDLTLCASVGRSPSRSVISSLLMCAVAVVFLFCSRGTSLHNLLAYFAFAGMMTVLLVRNSFSMIRTLRGPAHVNAEVLHIP